MRRSFTETMDGLGLDQLDLSLIHWPLPAQDDGDYVSTWKAVAGLVTEGRLRTAGVSNFQPAHLDRVIAETGLTPAVLSAQEVASIDALDQGESGRVGPNPDTYTGV